MPPVSPSPPLKQKQSVFLAAAKNRLKSDLQGVAQVPSVCREQESTNSETLTTPLVNDVRAEIDNFVLIRLRVTGQERAELVRLTGQKFLPRQAPLLAVRNTIHSLSVFVWRDTRSHKVVFRVDNEIGIVPPKLVEIIISLN